MNKPKTLVELFTDPKRWTKESYARTHTGRRTPFNHSAAVCWCLLGGIGFVYGNGTLATDARVALKELLPENVGLAQFNDCHTHEEVLDLCKRADV